MFSVEIEIQILIEPMFNTLSFEGNNQREINEFEENVQNSISKTTNRCWEHQKSKVRGISFNPFK